MLSGAVVRPVPAPDRTVGAVGGGAEGLAQNWATFADLVAEARRHLASRRWERAAVAARVAATYAWFNHPGVFASRELEEVLAELGARWGAAPAAERRPGRVLHVATELYATGGHTQMLAAWVAADPAHEHAVCLTGQRGRPLPDKLVQALGGTERVTELDRHADRLVDRAALLRGEASRADAVVLHPHPDDVVPGIAFAPGHRPPGTVFLVNHADHVFWVGTTAADVVLNMRQSGAELTRTRRGVPDERTDLLTRPLRLGRGPADAAARAAARRRLGVADGDVVVATAAAASKYTALHGPGFLDLVSPVLEAHPDARLLAAGPSPDGAWAELERRDRGRALGLLPDVSELYAAADVYVDSYPFSSLTSMLEAGGAGLPLLTLRPSTAEPEVLGADTPELDATLLVATTPEEHRSHLARLLADPGARTALGARTRAGVLAAHADGAWAARAAAVLSRPPVGELVAGPDVRRDGDLDRRVARLQAQTGWGAGRSGALTVNAPLLTAPERLRLAVRTVGSGQRPDLRALLSAGGQRRLRAVRARLR